MEIKTSELTGAVLDLAVAEAIGIDAKVISGEVFVKNSSQVFVREYSPSTNWEHGGRLVDDHRMYVEWDCDGWWCAHTRNGDTRYGATALTAICRAVVQDQLGDTVTVPNELEG